jgi:hypothetical protein
MRKNQRTKLVIQPNFTESGHHCALLIAHVSCPPAARIRLSPHRLCSPHSRARLARHTRAPASARACLPQPAPAFLAPRARPPHSAAASPRARARPPTSPHAGLARPTRAPASPYGRLALRTHAARLSPRPPRPAHTCPPPLVASSLHARAPLPASHVPCSPPHEHTCGLGLGLENSFSSIAMSGWGTGVREWVCLEMSGWGYYKGEQCHFFLLLSIF